MPIVYDNIEWTPIHISPPPNQVNLKQCHLPGGQKEITMATEMMVEDVLAKGLNYAVTPQHIPVVELITATESAIKNNNLKNEEAEQLRLKVSAALSSARTPPSNFTTEERRALSSLSKDPNITILPADKGRCTVVLNTTDYDCKITTLLSDSNTYEPLGKDPTSGYKKKVIGCLQQLEKEKAIDRILYHRLYPREATPCLYGLPKIHKEGAPLRPIVSSINSVTYSIAKFLANILAPLVGNTVHHIQNAKEFVTKIHGVTLEAEETMVSYDVTSLFTCIPTTEAIETVRNRLQHDNTLSSITKLSPNQVCLLLDLCLNTTYFKYKNLFYRQKHGCAIGSPVSPIVANLYMEEVERRALLTFQGTTPTHWFRYVDDTWVTIRSNEVAAFTEHINSVDNNIKFTREDVHENKLAFLDCLICIQEGGNLKTEVYRKPTHTDQYLLFDSHHPLEHKLGVIRTLHHRAECVATDTESKDKEQKHLRGALKACGYPDWAFVKTAATKPNRNTNRNNRPETHSRRNIVIPYVAGVSEKLRRIFNKHHVPVFFKPSNTLRQKLVHPKDQTPKEKQSNVVYGVQCSEECTDLYIGETKQLLSKRMAQHRRENSTGQNSAVFLHLKDKGHSFEDSKVQILDKEDRWFERGVKEMIHVKVERPSLNRGGGLRHHLSATYNAVHVWAVAEHVNPHCAFAVDRVSQGCGIKLMHPTLTYHVRLKGIRLVVEKDFRVLGYWVRLYHGPVKLGDDEGPYTIYPGEQGFEEWQEAAVQMLEECPCPEGDKRISLTENLRPPASQVVKLFCKAHLKASVRDCLKALEEVYGACDNPHTLLHMFRSLYQEDGENVSTFVQWLQSKLWTLVHKNIIPIAEVDEMRRTQLMHGLQGSHPIVMELHIMGEIMGVVKEREAELEKVAVHIKKATTGSSPSARNDLRGVSGRKEDSFPQSKRVPLAKTFSAIACLDCYHCGHQGYRVYQCYPPVDSGDLHSKGGRLPRKRKGTQKSQKSVTLPGVGRQCNFNLLVNGVPTTALFDTGSQLTIIHRPFYLQHLSHLPLQTVGPVPVFGVGTGPTYMDGCVEVQLHIPGLVGDNDPPITVVAYVSPPPGGKEAAPVIVCSNVKAVEEAFLWFLQPREGTPLTVLPVSPELQEICQTFAPESVGNPWHPVEIPPGGVQSLRVYVEIVSATPGSYFLLETDPCPKWLGDSSLKERLSAQMSPN
ncbi:LOW QUALITY PROTEIN: uncharacterized protein LOC121397622 [Xenopus laevis]|uniref:LOW QUALITY PROTEIN: uncharacterized protein LOC121397622 n=1 Tax=Xenopus laevis TaxID=8355 RepID=A0A8J1LPI9_XENLA|nr:LOW QUALITY PROTEIN: uncharacterized protein LOC121397622 [Xenopus laevis]